MRILCVREIVTYLHGRGWHLIAVVIVVVGLALTAPPSTEGLAGDHFGALLHPIFPHVHSYADTFEAEGSLVSHDASSRSVAPGLNAPLSEYGAREAAAGIVVPFVLAAALIELSRKRQLFEPRLIGRPVAPPTPPPRLLTAVA